MAPGLDNPPLVEGEGTEVAASEAAPGAYKAELHLLDCRHPSLTLVARMVGPHIGQGVDFVHLFHSKNMGRRVLDHILRAGLLQHNASGEWVGVSVLDGKAFGKLLLVSLHIFKRWQGDEIPLRQLRAFDHSTTDILQIFY